MTPVPKPGPQSSAVLALIFLSHDWEDHRVRVGPLKWASYIIYFFVLILKRRRCWNAAVAFSTVVTASAGDVVIHPDIWTTLVTALMQHRPDAWTRVQAVGCIKAAVIRVEAGRLQDVLMGSVLEMTALGVLMLIDFLLFLLSLPPNGSS